MAVLIQDTFVVGDSETVPLSGYTSDSGNTWTDCTVNSSSDFPYSDASSLGADGLAVRNLGEIGNGCIAVGDFGFTRKYGVAASSVTVPGEDLVIECDVNFSATSLEVCFSVEPNTSDCTTEGLFVYIFGGSGSRAKLRVGVDDPESVSAPLGSLSGVHTIRCEASAGVLSVQLDGTEIGTGTYDISPSSGKLVMALDQSGANAPLTRLLVESTVTPPAPMFWTEYVGCTEA